MHELGPVYRQSDTSKVNSWQEIHTVKSREKDWSVKHHSRHPQFTCPPVSGKPNTLAWPKYPWGDTTTTSKIMGILPKNFSSVDGSGAWRISRSRWIISNTCSDVSPQPFSRPHSWNLNVNKRKKKSDTCVTANYSSRMWHIRNIGFYYISKRYCRSF